MRSNLVFWLLGILIVGGLAVLGVLFWLGQSAPTPVEEVEVVYPQRETIGSSVEGRAIEAYTFGSGSTNSPQASSTPSTSSFDSAQDKSGQASLLFVGGIHGGYEWNSVALAYEMIDYLTDNRDLLLGGGQVTIIPSLNPDGVFKVVGREGRFVAADVPESEDQSAGRFNANKVDLNRNFDCKWQPKSTWRGNEVSAGTAAFSEPEARALRDFVLREKPNAVIFWHSQANAVYASECEDGILPETRQIMAAYAEAAGYKAVDTFDAYTVTGDAEGWLASIGVPAITVELATHETIEWEKNLAGVKALIQLIGQQR